MKKATFLLVFGLILVPATASASWWNPLTWKVFHQNDVVSEDVEEIASTTEKTFALPTTDDLYRRIAELEAKLEEARVSLQKQAIIASVTKKAAPVVAQSSPVSSGLSDDTVSEKVKPAIVLVETSVGSASGVVIDSRGYVVTNAHIILEPNTGVSINRILDDVTVFLSGKKYTAIVIGVDESSDIAIVKMTKSTTYPYIKPNYDAGLSVGQKAYVFSMPVGSVTIGYGTVSSVVTKKSDTSIEINTDKKPFDTGGAMVNDAGGFIGVAHNSSCKVLEEGKTCLKYTVTTDVLKSRISKLMLGMQLFKNKKQTKEERLVGGALLGMYNNIKGSQAIDFGIAIATGKNSFDDFNTKLGKDVDGHITRLYLAKLVSVADALHKASDVLKDQSYNLRTFLINENLTVSALTDYQQSIIKGIQVENEAKLKEYTAKVSFWSAQKNEYDGHLTNWADVSQNYLLEEGAFVESAAKYILTERERILNTFSGENVDVF